MKLEPIIRFQGSNDKFLRLVDGPVSRYLSVNSDELYLSSFSVNVEHRNKGWGRKVLLLIKDYAFQKQKPVVLQCEPFGRVRLSFETTKRFYMKNGFKDTSIKNIMTYIPYKLPATLTS